jgi:tetratricopeptide (TPR) repeat protein
MCASHMENLMSELTEQIKKIESQIEKALWELELNNQLEEALVIYQDAEVKLFQLPINDENPAYKEQQRVLSYCLMRQGNLLRQLKKPDEALALSEREITAARLSGDDITLARALMSTGTNYIVDGSLERGLTSIDEAQVLFEKGDSYDHKQGLGWIWILKADLANAGLVKLEPIEVIRIATHALEILKPLENWPGVARAYAARVKAYERQGDDADAAKDRQNQKEYENMIEPEG